MDLRLFGRLFLLAAMVALAVESNAQTGALTFEESQAFLKNYCLACHTDKAPAGGFRLSQVASPESLRQEAQRWTNLNTRVRNHEMPPRGSPAPGPDLRERFSGWVNNALRAEACAAGFAPGPTMIRRLNRDEYAATVRDLFDIHLDIAQLLPADGAGGEGFDNAAETLFLSPLHTEKYLEVARFSLDFAAKEFKSRALIFTAQPGPNLTSEQAARRILEDFLPRAFRRPVRERDIEPYMDLFRAAGKQGQPFEGSILYALRGALVSPMFLFRAEPPNTSADVRPLDQYALASRLSYFLWGSMPDELLFDVAAAGKLHDPDVLKNVIPRMLRNDRSLNFAQRFVDQWLRIRELDTDKAPDAELFAAYATDEELRSDIRLQPALFFRELFVQDLSVLSLLDSKHTIATSNLVKHMKVEFPIRRNASKQPQWVEVPEGTQRGGLLGMPAVLAVSSYPYRTSPVLRGAWILDSILGTPPPPPPPDVPALEEHKEGAAPKTVRERLTQHRDNPACASCHDRIDPLGFALENYDVIGRWRDEENGVPVDNRAEFPDGAKVQGPDQLKAVLLERKDLFLRNLTAKMLGYALGRGLTLSDSCTVDNIVAQLKENDYRAHALIEAIVLSAPFRYQTPAAPPAPSPVLRSQKE